MLLLRDPEGCGDPAQKEFVYMRVTETSNCHQGLRTQNLRFLVLKSSLQGFWDQKPEYRVPAWTLWAMTASHLASPTKEYEEYFRNKKQAGRKI